MRSPNVALQVDKLGMVGVNGGKFPAIREHLQQNIAGVYKDMDISYVHIHADAVLVSPTLFYCDSGSPRTQMKEELTPRLVRCAHEYPAE